MTYCRYVDFEQDLEPWQRGEKLHEDPELEYAVHGRYKMDEAAENGIHGCWWFELKELVRIFSEETVTAKLEAFEKELASERKQAMQRVCAEIAKGGRAARVMSEHHILSKTCVRAKRKDQGRGSRPYTCIRILTSTSSFLNMHVCKKKFVKTS